MKINTDVPERVLNQVVNPSQSYNCYDSKIIINFDLDDFKEFVEDHMGAYDQVHPDPYGLLDCIFPHRFNPIEQLSEGSGCNGNKQFDKYKNWRASLYDIWEEVTTRALEPETTN